MCPATMLANNRRDKLNTLNVVDINSIGGKISNSIVAAPCGQYKAKYFIPHSLNPINKIPNQVIKPKPSATDKLLVTVNPYGNKPMILNINININKNRMYGKYICTFLLMYDFTVLYTYIYIKSQRNDPIDILYIYFLLLST